MSWFQWTIISLFVCILLLAVTIYNSRKSGLSHIPGPFLARYTDAWNLWLAWSTLHNGTGPSSYRKLQAKYGSVIRTGPNSVTVLDPSAVPTIYGVRSHLAKSPSYIPFRQPNVTTSLLSIPEEHVHAKYRKLVSNAYSMSSIKGYEPYVDQTVARFVEVCREHAERKEPINFSVWCHYYCFDVISILTFGYSLGFLEGKDSLGLIQRIKYFRDYTTLVSQMPWLHKIFSDNFLLRSRKRSAFMDLVRDRIRGRMQEFKEEDKERPDFLSHLLASHFQHPETMTEQQVMIFASGNFIAGGFSPAATLNELCYYLVTHPNSQDRLFAEVQQAGSPTTFDELKNLPYLEGVIREAYRLHSSTSGTFQRVTNPDGLVLPNGCSLPGSAYVGCPSATINRDTTIFGPDAYEYNPERWLQGPNENSDEYSERRRAMDRAELSFGQGSRSCIGKSVVALEMFKVIASLVSHFKFELAGYPQKSEVKAFVHLREDVKR
ncbi:uncharacterized protein N7515_004510 [Penicillium bovifimosum]|uniref:Cytochrome P450 n=1 Tax=Penicillium bovifimosum TaxID=126998 RepID=A0A9W9H096_9EURO|nr:uncharacterized protein N7515_004510 [Penicillium bovifimosum]KAJ5135232.1 hypothetical protein N7515_004510 [Penicillium bovifimosum]